MKQGSAWHNIWHHMTNQVVAGLQLSIWPRGSLQPRQGWVKGSVQSDPFCAIQHPCASPKHGEDIAAVMSRNIMFRTDWHVIAACYVQHAGSMVWGSSCTTNPYQLDCSIWTTTQWGQACHRGRMSSPIIQIVVCSNYFVIAWRKIGPLLQWKCARHTIWQSWILVIE